MRAAVHLASNSYAASWLSGVTQDATRPSDVLVSFTNFCVPIGGGAPRAAGFGLAECDPATNTLDHEATVFTASSPQPLAAQEQLGSPVFAGGYLYLFAAHCADDYDLTCLAGDGNAVYLARVPADPMAWDDPAAYQWRAGPAGWTAAPCAAVSVISGATPLAVNVNEFPALRRGLVLVEQTSSTGGTSSTRRPSLAGHGLS
jgi:hypothetical protein